MAQSDSLTREERQKLGHTDNRLVRRFRLLLNDGDIYFDFVTLLLSYAFILFAAWNDDLLGLPPNFLTWGAEYLLAAGLAVEIALRLWLVTNRTWFFYLLIIIDAISILTIIPSLVVVTFSRLVRLAVTGVRMLHLIDRISQTTGNPFLILLVYPFVVPLAAALFYALERHAIHGQVHNYFQSLILMLSYSLTIGLASNHPVTYVGKVIAGVMLLTGLMCVSIVGNALSDRYTVVRAAKIEDGEMPLNPVDRSETVG